MTTPNNTFPLIYDPEILTVAQLARPIELSNSTRHLQSQTVTSDEISLVAPQKFVDQLSDTVAQQESGWQSLKIDQVLDFNMVGVLATLSHILAAARISIFVISTFKTDYLLIQQSDMPEALKTLSEKGFKISTME